MFLRSFSCHWPGEDLCLDLGRGIAWLFPGSLCPTRGRTSRKPKPCSCSQSSMFPESDPASLELINPILWLEPGTVATGHLAYHFVTPLLPFLSTFKLSVLPMKSEGPRSAACCLREGLPETSRPAVLHGGLSHLLGCLEALLPGITWPVFA